MSSGIECAEAFKQCNWDAELLREGTLSASQAVNSAYGAAMPTPNDSVTTLLSDRVNLGRPVFLYIFVNVINNGYSLKRHKTPHMH